MTLVIAWVGYDTHGITSAYIASESRVSWSDHYGEYHYDCCRKVFNSDKYPEIVGYCGDVLFPSMIINSIFDNIDHDLIFSDSDSANIRYKKFKTVLLGEFKKYPVSKLSNAFEIIYINKDITENIYPNFYVYNIGWKKGRGFISNKIIMPGYSSLIYQMGSGSTEFISNFDSFKKSKNRDTTRNIYHCFSYTLKKIREKTCGGPPQLVGLYRKPKSNGISYGLLYNSVRYFNGLKVPKLGGINKIEWRNQNFEICDGIKRKKKHGSKDQPIDTAS